MKQCLYCDKSDNVVAYCELHKCYITKKQMDCKKCLSKNCHHFKKNNLHPYWKFKETQKEKRRKRKEIQEAYYQMIKAVK